jgi:DNA replication ATP-dependent helicase Dna2
MMKRLADNYPESVAQLTYQYRMHEDICRLSSKAVYDGKMKCGNEKVRLQRLDLPSYPDGLPSPLPGAKYNWLVPVINPVRSVAFVDTDQLRKHPEAKENVSNRGNDSLSEPLEGKVGGRAGGNVVNTTEAVLARCLIEGLVSAGMSPRDIGLICPFRAQLRLLDEDPKIARWKAAGLELSTIDRYQGRDKQVIILSFVRSNTSGKVGRLLQDMRRLNVAFTRAKCKFIMIGSFSTLHKGSEPLRSLLDQLNPNIERWRLKPEALHCYDI